MVVGDSFFFLNLILFLFFKNVNLTIEFCFCKLTQNMPMDIM